ncbi:DUF2214 domain-containing protein [Acuticoccus sp. M5D2P5]|uniref:DUF2214 domain-containing protein n=1 Tax=Acuticoccus kalidii TaxID=2910977 RepID=UPI001F1E21B4|nr:DUF2214 domain-containing protein [Acuticoccus kalidii]MCF3936471.1 DUF2214 domain-containing protein [Acuticoccus kalidii]
MEALLAWIEASAVGSWARTSRWGYAGVSAAHILGLAMLVGAMIPLNLARLGWIARDVGGAGRLLVPFAGAGLALAVLTGLVLFSARAGEYAGLGFFQAKIGLIVAGTVTALVLHRHYGLYMERATPARRAFHAGLSLALWPVVLLLGRLIAFAG